MKNFLRHATGVAGVSLFALTAVCYLCGFGASSSWILEIFTHFRLVYLALFAVSLVLLVLANYRKLAAITLFLLVLASINVAKYFVSQHARAAGATIKVVQMNLWGGKNRQFEKALSVARNGNPDVIVLSEVTMPWWLRFVQEFPEYSHQLVEPRYGGVGILSKLPMKNAEIRYFGKKKRPRICAQLITSHGPLDMILVHTVTPFYLPPMRDGELQVVAEEARVSKNPVVVLGDINCSPWSPVFSRFLMASGLNDSEQGFGIQPSWAPHAIPFPIIPIDHIFVSENIEVVTREIGQDFGSDHRPVTVQLSLKQ